MEIKNNQINIKKIYNLKCIKCNKNAKFDNNKELKKYYFGTIVIYLNNMIIITMLKIKN